MDSVLLVEMAALLLAIGALAGVLAGLLGVGGGVVLVPGFYYAFASLGYETPQLMQICLATSLATIIVTSARSVMSHHKKCAVEWGILKIWAPGIVLGAIAGKMTVSALNTTVLQYIFGGLLVFIGLYMTFGNKDFRVANELPKGLKGRVFSPFVGFLSVLMGIGGGSFGVPLLTMFGVPVHRAVATAAGFGFIIAVPSVAGFLMTSLPEGSAPPLNIGAVNIAAFLVVITMTTFTAPIGAAIAHKTDAGKLKKFFGMFLILIALNMLRKAILS